MTCEPAGSSGKTTSLDFEFTPEQKAFAAEVTEFLDANDDPEVFDVSRENMAQIVDTPKRRAFMKSSDAKAGWESPGRQNTADPTAKASTSTSSTNNSQSRGGPQIGKGVGIIGKTLIAHGSDRLKQEFLPQILENDVEFASVIPEPDAGFRRCGHETQGRTNHQRRRRKRLVTQRSKNLDDICALRRVVLGRCPYRSRQQAHGDHLDAGTARPRGDQHHRHSHNGDERTNEVWFDDVFVSDDYVVGQVNYGFRYISQALDLERFTLFTMSPILQRLEVLTDT